MDPEEHDFSMEKEAAPDFEAIDSNLQLMAVDCSSLIEDQLSDFLVRIRAGSFR
jgi:hypothetical protein